MLFVLETSRLTLLHRVRHHRRRARRDRGHPARGEVPARTGRRTGPRLRLRELRRHLHPAGAWPDRGQLPGQPARLPDPGRRVRGPRRAVARCTSSGAASLWRTELDHHPLDVVAWHGNYAPYKYDLRRYSPVGPLLFDHADPSIFTVLTAPSETPGTANVDFVVFPDRWMVAEDTFRPPWYHMNIMSEFMGLIYGVYDAKPQGFVPGGFSLHNCMLPHGPDAEAFEAASTVELKPVKYEGTHGLHVRDLLPAAVTAYAADLPELQDDYVDCWQGLEKRFDPDASRERAGRPDPRSGRHELGRLRQRPSRLPPARTCRSGSSGYAGRAARAAAIRIGDEVLDLAGAGRSAACCPDAAQRAAEAGSGSTLNRAVRARSPDPAGAAAAAVHRLLAARSG